MEFITETLRNNNGMETTLLNLGATLTSITVPGPEGERVELTLGYENPEGYIGDKMYFGSTPGRFANRIGGGRFSLNGREYNLSLNNGENHLHGGTDGFAQKFWDISREGDRVVFSYTSPDGENGYPGALTARTAYSLNNDNELSIEYTAESDKDTILNLTNHAYFKLNPTADDILDHELCLEADSFVVTDKENIPTGEIRPTEGSPLDMSAARRLRDIVACDYDVIRNAGGIDSCFVIKGEGFRRAAVLTEPESGRALEVLTDLPGIQVYTGHLITAGTIGRGGQIYGPFSGVCLEAQRFPDAPNHPSFPSAVLKAGEAFSARIVYKLVF
ncbi:MAG: galactose mutarotase [Treponema sp.]|nr:galactose mutarotase [Treponema sp.]